MSSMVEQMTHVVSDFFRCFKSPKKAMQENAAFKEFVGLLNALIIAMAIRTFLFQPFVIPSESMYPTLMIGDFLFVNKFSYGYSNRTFPFAPDVIDNRVWATEPKQGDVVVFYNPKHLNDKRLPEPVDYVKRLVGMPGDRVKMMDGVLHINGAAVLLEPIADYHMVDGKRGFALVPQYIETLPNGVKHPILKSSPMGKGWLDNTEEYVVPEGHYFLMGDNRDNSSDSRVKTAVGFVPSKNIVGRADFIFLSHLGHLWKPWTWLNVRWGRWPHVIR